jgi:hypothetical protein
VVSGAVAWAGWLVLFAPSVAVTSSSSPFFAGKWSRRSDRYCRWSLYQFAGHFPFHDNGAARLGCTGDVSAIRDTATPSGIAGGVVSGAFRLAGALGLPASSVAITDIFSPLMRAGESVIVKWPVPSAVVVPITVPALFLMVTMLPASAVPVT